VISESKALAKAHLAANWDVVRGISTRLHADPETGWQEVRGRWVDDAKPITLTESLSQQY